MKIYTKTGDKGETSLVTGTRVKKYHIRIETYGTIDELNSHLGLLRSLPMNDETVKLIICIQNHLFTVGSNLSLDDKKINFTIPEITENNISFIEKQIDEISEQTPPFTGFVLPGGNISVAQCHIARTVCRRAERLIIRLADENNVDERIIRYVNRLSDLLFVLARKLAKDQNTEETLWTKD